MIYVLFSFNVTYIISIILINVTKSLFSVQIRKLEPNFHFCIQYRRDVWGIWRFLDLYPFVRLLYREGDLNKMNKCLRLFHANYRETTTMVLIIKTEITMAPISMTVRDRERL